MISLKALRAIFIGVLLLLANQALACFCGLTTSQLCCPKFRCPRAEPYHVNLGVVWSAGKAGVAAEIIRTHHEFGLVKVRSRTCNYWQTAIRWQSAIAAQPAYLSAGIDICPRSKRITRKHVLYPMLGARAAIGRHEGVWIHRFVPTASVRLYWKLFSYGRTVSAQLTYAAMKPPDFGDGSNVQPKGQLTVTVGTGVLSGQKPKREKIKLRHRSRYKPIGVPSF